MPAKNFRSAPLEGVWLDVGESESFFLSCSKEAWYTTIGKGTCSVAFLVEYISGNRECMHVRWCRQTVYSPDRSFVAAELVDHMIPVPKHHGTETKLFRESVVEITFREYIDGDTLSELWSELDDADKSSIACQVTEMVGRIHQVKSKYHGHVVGIPYASESSYDYMTKMYMRAKLLDHVNRFCTFGDRVESNDKPTLCHNNLCPAHIIIRNKTVVGVVGWSQADFCPPVMEKTWYAFFQCDLEHADWYCRLASSIQTLDVHDSGFATLVRSFAYELAWANWGHAKRQALSSICHSMECGVTWDLGRTARDAESHQSQSSLGHTDALRVLPRRTSSSTVASFDFDLDN